MGSGRTAGVVGAFCVGVFAACSHGIYDGSTYAADAGARANKVVEVAGGAPTVVITDDKYFALQIPAGAFPAPTRIEIKQLADRSILDSNRNTIIVPVYEVTASTPIAAGKRVAVILSAGSNFPGPQSPDSRIGVALVEGTSLPSLLVGGLAPNGAEYFGLATKLGTFTIEVGSEKTFPGGPGPLGCFYGCCTSNTMENRSCVGGLPFCARNVGGGGGRDSTFGSAGNTDFKCYLDCTDLDLTAATNVCNSISDGGAASPRPTLTCTPAGAPGGQKQCAAAEPPCCVSPGPGSQAVYTCENDCPIGLKLSCTSHGNCANGESCCVIGNETKCVQGGCGGPSRVCANGSNGDCTNGDTCTPTAKCPFGVCSKSGAPAVCQ